MKKTRFFLFALLSVIVSIQLNAFPNLQNAQTGLFSTEHGLSSTKITSILHESRNFLWVGTEDGLNKFNGYNFTVYKTQSGDSLSLVSNHITALFQDSRNRMWVATIAGLEYYDIALDGFINVSLHQPDEVLKNNQCTDIIEDKNGNLWFAASGYGVVCYSPETETSVLFSPDANNEDASLCSTQIRSIIEDKNGNIWFASQDNGISVYNPQSKTFRNYNPENSTLPANAVFNLYLLENGNILVSTMRCGLVIYDAQKEVFNSYMNVFNKPSIRSIFCASEDGDGNIVVGTEGNGLMIFDPQKRELSQHPIFKELNEIIGNTKIHYIKKGNYSYIWIALSYKGLFFLGNEKTAFQTIRKINNEPNSLNYDQVTGVTTDRDNNIWIATDGGGLNLFNPRTSTFTYYTCNPNDPNSISDNAVVSVLCDSKNRIWVGTYIGGLCLFNRESGTFTQFRADHSQPDALQSDYIICMREDRRGNLWLGTNGGGLTRFDPDKKTFKTYRSANNKELVNDYINTLFIDSKNRLWIGTFFGLSCMDIDAETFTHFDRNNGLSSLSVFSIAEDVDGTIWIGTADGLDKYDPGTNSFTKTYPKDQRYYSPVVNGILAHKSKRQLWLSTNHGIVNYDFGKNELSRFFFKNGLESNEFIMGSYYRSPDGRMFFGGVNGLNIFNPDEVTDQIATPQVYISNLSIFNEPVPINKEANGRIILTQNIELTKKITLMQSEKNFTLDFVAMGILDPYMAFYSFMLEGFDKDWTIYDYSHRSVTYTNLNPGTYTFRIKASSNPDVWLGNETALIIEIKPTVWNTWWARTLYGIAAALFIVMVVLYIIGRIKTKNKLRIERMKAKQQEELYNAKTEFFTSISHEFRTPLTLIIGPAERLLKEEIDENKIKTERLILRNAGRLQNLINQILDLNKMEDGRMQLHAQEIELVSFVTNLISPFEELMKQKHIEFTYTWKPDTINVWYDRDMFEKCLNNLIYNAYKFTPEKGKIQVDISQMEDGKVQLSVKDTGIGMDEETKEHVFDRYYQGYTDQSNRGTGIGMHLAKTIVNMHKGDIHLESEPGKGSTFTVTILPGNSHFTADELIDIKKAPQVGEKPGSILAHEEVLEATREPAPAKNHKHDANRPLVLLVEDDADMRLFIRQELENQYRIEEAPNGKKGLEKAHRLMPDLIITDVMMPEMDGIELCRILKTETDTSHIPIIILTAQGSTARFIEGLETGADSYIAKPFSMKHLKIRVEKLIEVRNVMKERFSKSISMDAQAVTLTSTDERLLQNAIDYVRNNMENPELGVEDMSHKLGLSRTHLHRKLKALTGQTPIDFIRMIRMKQAAYLLSTGKITVSEVGYRVGYNTLSYFSSSFNSYFGMTPTAYIETHANGKEETKDPS